MKQKEPTEEAYLHIFKGWDNKNIKVKSLRESSFYFMIDDCDTLTLSILHESIKSLIFLFQKGNWIIVV